MAVRLSRRTGIGLVLALAGVALLMQRGLAPLPSSGAEGSARELLSTMARVTVPAEGQPLPAFSFVDIAGQKHTNDSLRGSVVLLDVWASWCGPCKEEMPGFARLQTLHAARGLRVIGISIDMTAGDAAKFAREMGVTYPIVHRPEIMAEWGLLGLPTTFIVDRAGIIRRKVIGFEHTESFEQTILELL